MNGFVVVQLSKRFRTSGGYYTYAFQVLSDRVGFSTGWVYLFYSLLFGLAYAIGAVYVVSVVFGFPTYLTLLAIVLPSSALLIAGIRPSAKYAIYTGIAEICLILIITGISFHIVAGSAYLPNPASYHISSGALALGILFAMGIPTGYGAIAPISGEVKNAERVVGKSTISVILAGGLLASMFIYAMSNLLFQTGSPVPSGSSSLPIISIISQKFLVYGRYLVFAVSIAAINDGILAILSFGAATSRTMFRMGYDRTFPHVFAKKLRGQPIVSNVTVALVVTIFPLIMILNFPVSTSFIILGTIASLGGLFIHIMAGSSLLRVGLRRGKRLLFRGTKTFFGIILDYREALLAGVASTITAVELIYSEYSTALLYTTVFLLWIVAGYIFLDIRDVVLRAPYSSRLTKGEMSVAERFKDLTGLKIRNALPDVVVSMDDTLKSAVDKCVSLDAQGAVVIDNLSIPKGTLTLRDLFMLSESELEHIHVRDWWLDRSVTVKSNTGILDIIRTFKETRVPILSIVDSGADSQAPSGKGRLLWHWEGLKRRYLNQT